MSRIKTRAQSGLRELNSSWMFASRTLKSKLSSFLMGFEPIREVGPVYIDDSTLSKLSPRRQQGSVGGVISFSRGGH